MGFFGLKKLWGFNESVCFVRAREGAENAKGFFWRGSPDLFFLVRHDNAQYKFYNKFFKFNSMRI